MQTSAHYRTHLCVFSRSHVHVRPYTPPLPSIPTYINTDKTTLTLPHPLHSSIQTPHTLTRQPISSHSHTHPPPITQIYPDVFILPPLSPPPPFPPPLPQKPSDTCTNWDRRKTKPFSHYVHNYAHTSSRDSLVLCTWTFNYNVSSTHDAVLISPLLWYKYMFFPWV